MKSCLSIPCDTTYLQNGNKVKKHISFLYCNYFILFIYFLVFRDRVSLCSPGCPGTHSIDQAGLELRNLPASASRVLELKACATMPGLAGRFQPLTYLFIHVFIYSCMYVCIYLFMYVCMYLFIFWFFETGFLCIALAVLELTL